MKTVTLAAVSALIGTPALAQAPPSPPPAPAPVYNWTGFYVGGNVGVSFGTVKTDLNQAPGAFAATRGGPPIVTPIPGFAQPDDELYPSGFIGGGQIGYNWQISPIWVLGVEADIQGADEKESTNFSNKISFVGLVPGSEGPTNLPVSGTAVTNYATKIEWFGTARVRAGYVWGDGTVFSYVTGGLAYGKVDVGGASTSTFSFNVSDVLSVTQAFDHSNVNTGWVVGSGTEGKLLIPGWTYKIEALYMDLGHLDATGSGGSASIIRTVRNLSSMATVGPVSAHSHFTDTILRVGLNYQFH